MKNQWPSTFTAFEQESSISDVNIGSNSPPLTGVLCCVSSDKRPAFEVEESDPGCWSGIRVSIKMWAKQSLVSDWFYDLLYFFVITYLLLCCGSELCLTSIVSVSRISCLPSSSIFIKKTNKNTSVSFSVALDDMLLHYHEHTRCSLFWHNPKYAILLP